MAGKLYGAFNAELCETIDSLYASFHDDYELKELTGFRTQIAQWLRQSGPEAPEPLEYIRHLFKTHPEWREDVFQQQPNWVDNEFLSLFSVSEYIKEIQEDEFETLWAKLHEIVRKVGLVDVVGGDNLEKFMESSMQLREKFANVSDPSQIPIDAMMDPSVLNVLRNVVSGDLLRNVLKNADLVSRSPGSKEKVDLSPLAPELDAIEGDEDGKIGELFDELATMSPEDMSKLQSALGTVQQKMKSSGATSMEDILRIAQSDDMKRLGEELFGAPPGAVDESLGEALQAAAETPASTPVRKPKEDEDDSVPVFKIDRLD